MGVEIVQHQTNLDSFRVKSSQGQAEQGEFLLGALAIDLSQTFTSQGFDGRQKGTGTVLFISIVFLTYLTLSHSDWVYLVSNEKTGTLVKANHWEVRVVSQGIQPENLLQFSQEDAVYFTDAPVAFPVGL